MSLFNIKGSIRKAVQQAGGSGNGKIYKANTNNNTGSDEGKIRGTLQNFADSFGLGGGGFFSGLVRKTIKKTTGNENSKISFGQIRSRGNFNDKSLG